MIGSHPPFRIGQRVRASQRGIDALLFPGKKALRSGVVRAVDEWNCPTVLWDGRLTTDTYHPDFITVDKRRKRP